ncbi:NACHT domain-containing protein [Lyngbya sp. CCAP 1446/10]|uniref:NACHT C-terminal alpha/beta 1 domain-containing protein n=1 Tax=Lyngbya sp. CCAP 1446/10 TaxID=439293 RepID=UPI0022370DD0|nr:HEAT repeat domain-containing protein [Lyngbya sp. CCAP 1446/10]MCW6051709.1 NACHT domain-containing protein [Lyngbya sp. CCAP 1446/10]
MAKYTYGSEVKMRVQRLLEALLAFVNWEVEGSFKIEFKWEAEDSTNPKLIFKTTLVALEQLTAKDKHPGKLTKTQIREALNLLKKFLKILEDNRTQTKGVDTWHFTLTLWSKDREKNLKQFDKAWEDSRPEKSKALAANSQKSDKFDWRDICHDRLEKQKQLTTNRLMLAKAMVFNLDDIDVDLALVERKKPDKRSEDDRPEKSRFYQPDYEETEKLEYQEFLAKVLKSNQTNKIAVIGEAGAGKTTLLQKIAFWILEKTDYLPIWIPLGNLPTPAPQLKEYLLNRWLEDAIFSVTPEIKANFEKQLTAGKVWLLLDGVDEMAASGNPLTFVDEWIPDWSQHLPVILICRLNVWEANPYALNGFQTYRTLWFSEEKVKQFIDDGFKKSDPALGIQLQEALNQPGKERIKDLVRNPLRLMLLCSIWYLLDGKLPDTKAELYQQYVEEVYRWKEEEFRITPEEKKQLNIKLKELALQAIKYEGNRFCLQHKFIESVFNNDSLFQLALKVCWLNPVGVDAKNPLKPVYAFYHPTFEEYFAATAIDDWSFFLPRQHQDKPLADKYRIFEPKWEEVILLWLGRDEEIINKQKEEFITALVEFNDGCGVFYGYRAFFTAAKGIAEVEQYASRLEIVKKIVHWSFGYLSGELNEWLTDVPAHIVDAAKKILRETNRSSVISHLTDLLNSPNEYIRIEVADILGQFIPGHPAAVECLINLIQTSYIPGVRMKAVMVLANIGKDNQERITHMVKLIHTSCDPLVHSIAAQSLGKSDPNHPDAILFTVTIEPNSFEESSESKEIETNHEDTIKLLISNIRTSSDESINFEVVQSLRHIIKLHPSKPAVSALKQNLHIQVNDDKGFKLHQICCEFLWYCAQNLPYPDFYQAWHPDTIPNSATASLNLANLPQILTEAINNQPDLCSKVKLICIDTHQFIEPENPAPEIYDEMQNQNCPEWQNGYPDTMQKLKLYWNFLGRQSEIPLFFICYDSTALSPTPTGFSALFLKALSKFDRAICIVCETEHIPLQTFSPSQPNLIAEIVAWMRQKMMENM